MSKSVAAKQITNNISQLLKFNCVKTERRKVQLRIRHSKNLETPLPAATGKRGLVDFFCKRTVKHRTYQS